ncbi:MAG: hypothetical protein DMG96_05455 [Acidobacteria bacterium]|nr:MAG: hypothetical protein DMG96_05455 [Acidobacteriota bacterium]
MVVNCLELAAARGKRAAGSIGRFLETENLTGFTKLQKKSSTHIPFLMRRDCLRSFPTFKSAFEECLLTFRAPRHMVSADFGARECGA